MSLFFEIMGKMNVISMGKSGRGDSTSLCGRKENHQKKSNNILVFLKRLEWLFCSPGVKPKPNHRRLRGRTLEGLDLRQTYTNPSQMSDVVHSFLK